MHTKSLISDVPLSQWRVLLWLSAAALVFVLGASTVSGVAPGEQVNDAVEAESEFESATWEEREPAESVTMAIQLEEGGTIDLDTSLGDVTIDTWGGDEVLVILEKNARPKAGGKPMKRVQPIDIQVTRRGKDIRIETLGATSRAIRDLDISFRIMVPQGQGIRSTFVNDGYSISKLTSVIMRVLHKEAMKWIVR